MIAVVLMNDVPVIGSIIRSRCRFDSEFGAGQSVWTSGYLGLPSGLQYCKRDRFCAWH